MLHVAFHAAATPAPMSIPAAPLPPPHAHKRHQIYPELASAGRCSLVVGSVEAGGGLGAGLTSASARSAGCSRSCLTYCVAPSVLRVASRKPRLAHTPAFGSRAVRTRTRPGCLGGSPARLGRSGAGRCSARLVARIRTGHPRWARLAVSRAHGTGSLLGSMDGDAARHPLPPPAVRCLEALEQGNWWAGLLPARGSGGTQPTAGTTAPRGAPPAMAPAHHTY